MYGLILSSRALGFRVFLGGFRVEGLGICRLPGLRVQVNGVWVFYDMRINEIYLYLHV